MTFGGRRERSLFCQWSVLIHQASEEFRDIQPFVLSQQNMTSVASVDWTEVQGLLMVVSPLKWKSTRKKQRMIHLSSTAQLFCRGFVGGLVKKKGRMSPSSVGKLSSRARDRQLADEVTATALSSLAELEVTFRKWQWKGANTTMCVPEIKDTLKTSKTSLKDWI